MDQILVRGGNKLAGRVKISGAKNAVLPILAASLMSSQGEVNLTSVPELMDVAVMRDVLISLGASATHEGENLTIDARHISGSEAPYNLVSKMRASVLVMGPLLGRTGRARVPLPGGCAIGTRPLDLHLKGFQLLGAEVFVGKGYVEASADRLLGSTIYLDYPSVGATENIMMAACFAEGETKIQNAAEEPEIVDLACFINSMGGRVDGAGTDTITIHGVRTLRGSEYRVIPDRIEAGTFMVAAAISGGRLVLENVIPEHVVSITAKLRELGVTITWEEDCLVVQGNGRPAAVDLKTLPYPGFPTDMQPQMMALLALAAGNCMVTETVFENRFMHVPELRRMGADIRIDGRSALVQGRPAFSGVPVEASDLRAGAALILAALAAEGVTEVHGVHHVERGYDDIVAKLKAVGADIWRSV
ncbi:MAG TPA: UDP-N-acetylglucosamine 1-carboxyvinyltransferase [Bacillota bacterium]|nr:UDP-N-acetylglucosamine 1-carboxyvinyltransferase [Bacillota bacterium]